MSALAAGYTLRAVTPTDAERIASHRLRMFLEAGWADDTDMQAMNTHFLPWLRERLANGVYFGWFAMHGEVVAAGLGMFWLEWPPHPLDPGTKRGYILNVYTEPAHRRLGLFKLLMERATATSREHGARVTALHATAIGRPLYEMLGFKGTSEMFLIR